MAAIRYVTPEQAPAEVQATYDAVKTQMGTVVNILRAMAHNPGLLQTFLALNVAAGDTELDAKLRDLAYLKVSRINNCAYCAHYHRISGRHAGLTEPQMREVENSEESSAYDELQRDVMRYAEQVTCDIHPDAALLETLKARLGERALMELTFTIALANFTNRFNVALAIDLP